VDVRSVVQHLYEINAIKFGEFILKSGKKSPYYIDLRILSSHPEVLEEVGDSMARMIEELPEKPTRLCGVPMAGLAIANVISLKTRIPACYTRKEPIIYRELAEHLSEKLSKKEERLKLAFRAPSMEDFDTGFREGYEYGLKRVLETIEEMSGFKTHGITRYVDGELKDGDKVMIVDDLITTAKSKLEARDLVKLEAKRRNLKNVEVIGVCVLVDREQGGKEALEKEGLPLYSAITIREAARILLDLGKLPQELYSTIIEYTERERKALGLD